MASLNIVEGTLSDLTASSTVFPNGTIINVVDKGTQKTGNGINVFSALAYNVLPTSGGAMTGAITAIRETKVAMATDDIDLSAGNLFTKTITAVTTFTVSNVLGSGNANSFILELTNAGSQTITWMSGVKWAGGIAPVLTLAGVDILGFYSHDGGDTWRAMVLAKDSK